MESTELADDGTEVASGVAFKNANRHGDLTGETHGVVEPDTHLDAAFGDGALPMEKLLPNVTAVIGVVLIFWYGAVTPSLDWEWWRYLIAVALIGVVLVPRTPLYLRRPIALLFVATTPMLATIMSAPRGFAWLPAVLVAKLVLGAVREEPYRPSPLPSGK